MSYSFANSIVWLKLLTDRICEGKNKKNGLFLVSYQVLFVLNENERVSPKELVLSLGLAKSNLAIIAKKMMKDGLIERTKDLQNRKEIYYNITLKGKEVLMAKLAQIENSCNESEKKETSLLQKVVQILKGIKF
mgnify:FL=1